MHLLNFKLPVNIIATFILFIIIVFSGVTASYIAFLVRQLHNEIKQEMDNKNSYQAIWSKLLLEYSTLTSLKRVEYIAINDLQMIYPDYKKCRFVDQCSM